MTTINQFYRLRCVTNLHVGSGETNYGVIDKLIERDAASGFPCINSSGLKGAIKQHFSDKPSNMLIEVFGSDSTKNQRNKDKVKSDEKQSSGKDDDAAQGKCNFLPAHLLALPVRSDKTPFFLATCPKLIDSFLSNWEDIAGSKYPSNDVLKMSKDNTLKATAHIGADLGQTGKTVIGIMGTAALGNDLKSLLNTEHDVVLLTDELMVELCNDLNLPVIARNALEDGQSKNLWYEQVLPRESVLYFPILWDKNRSSDFDLTNGMLQVGGNASVGYGFTKLSLIS